MNRFNKVSSESIQNTSGSVHCQADESIQYGTESILLDQDESIYHRDESIHHRDESMQSVCYCVPMADRIFALFPTYLPTGRLITARQHVKN